MPNLSRRSLLTVSAAATLLPPFSPAHAKASTERGFNDDHIEWVQLQDGIKRASKKSRPIFLIVRATWCPVCTEYKALFFDKRVAHTLNSKFVPVLIDADEEEDLQAKYAPDGDYVPRSIVLESDGTLLEEVKLDEDEYVHFLAPDEVDPLLEFLEFGKLHYELSKRKNPSDTPTDSETPPKGD